MHRATVALLVALGLLMTAPPAWADGDPASDILLAQDVFLPYPPNTVSKPVEKALLTTVERAKQKGFTVKVALIADTRDLGSVGQLFGEPQKYADLLTTTISFNVDPNDGDPVKNARVLTVHPGGLGGNNLGDNAGDALEGVFPVTEEGPDGLARAAAVAVGKLAAAEGKPIELPELPAAAGVSSGGGGVPSFVLFGAPVLLLLLVVVGLNRRMANAEPEGEPEPGGEPEPEAVREPVPPTQ